MLRLQLAFESGVEQRGLEGGEVVEFFPGGSFEGAGAFGESIEVGDGFLLLTDGWDWKNMILKFLIFQTLDSNAAFNKLAQNIGLMPFQKILHIFRRDIFSRNKNFNILIHSGLDPINTNWERMS